MFLIKEEHLAVDEYFIKKIDSYEFKTKNYPKYFELEILHFKNEKLFSEIMLNHSKEQLDDFNEMRNKGENESYICKLIREDSIKNFIIYFNKNCISPNAIINPSIYETNSFLLENQIQSNKDITLIEYAAFFGSIQIFTFLKNMNANLTPSLWFYVIHSKNAELIHLLEELHIEPTLTAENK